jgi:hypothetical protein
MDADALKRIQNADLIWAEVCGGKLDGKFIPLWISQDVADRMAKAGKGLVEAKAYMIPLSDAAPAEIMRAKLVDVKGPSAKWPEGLEMLRGPDGTYFAKRGR